MKSNSIRRVENADPFLLLHAFRSLQGKLTRSEMSLYQYILDRALDRKSNVCNITVRSVVEGTDCGRWCGLNMSEKTVSRCLNSLQQKGFIEKTGRPNSGTLIVIDLDKLSADQITNDYVFLAEQNQIVRKMSPQPKFPVATNST